MGRHHREARGLTHDGGVCPDPRRDQGFHSHGSVLLVGRERDDEFAAKIFVRQRRSHMQGARHAGLHVGGTPAE